MPSDARYYYSREQVNLLTRYLRAGFRNSLAITNSDVAHVIGAMHRDGITITFPKPRYHAQKHWTPGRWEVYDRTDRDSYVAVFMGVGAESYARQHADRLNEMEA